MCGRFPQARYLLARAWRIPILAIQQEYINPCCLIIASPYQKGCDRAPMNWGKHPPRCTINARCARHNGQVPWPRYHGPLTNRRHCFQRKHLMGSIHPSGIERKIPKKAEKAGCLLLLPGIEPAVWDLLTVKILALYQLRCEIGRCSRSLVATETTTEIRYDIYTLDSSKRSQSSTSTLELREGALLIHASDEGCT